MLSNHYSSSMWRILWLAEYKVDMIWNFIYHIKWLCVLFYTTIRTPHRTKISAVEIFWDYPLWLGLEWDDWGTCLGHKVQRGAEKFSN